MKRLAILAAILVGVAALAVASAPLIISTDLVKHRIADQIANWTDRAVTFRGEPSVSFYPYLTVQLSDVALAEPPGMGDQPFMTMDVLMGKFRLLPLLFGRVEITEFRLVRPRINLRIDAAGRPNWEMNRGTVGAEAAEADLRPSPTAKGKAIPPANITLGRFIIRDGVIDYADETAGQHNEATAVNIDVSWPSTSQAATGSGSLIWRDQPVEFNASLATPMALLAGGVSPMRFALASKPVRIAFTGKVLQLDNLQVEGDASLTTPSVRQAIEWAGTPMGPGAILGAASLKGKIKWIGSSISFSQASIEFDGNSAEGALSVSYTRGRPTFQGTLDFEKLDLTPYVEASRADMNANGSWLAAPARLPTLTACDLDIRVSAGAVIIGAKHLGRAAAAAAIKDGRLTVTIGDAQLYGGHLQAEIAAEMQDDAVVGSAKAKIDGVSAKLALLDLAGVGALEGASSLDIDVKGMGRSWGEFAEALSGTARLSIADASLAGIEVRQFASRMAARDAGAIVPGAGATAFSAISATLRLAEGALSTDDFHAEGPGYEVGIAGSASLLTQLVEAKGTLTMANSATAGEPAEIPFAIAGTWRAPVFLPDAERAFKRSARAPRAGNTIGLEDFIRPHG
jgi:AsmA protein